MLWNPIGVWVKKDLAYSRKQIEVWKCLLLGAFPLCCAWKSGGEPQFAWVKVHMKGNKGTSGDSLFNALSYTKGEKRDFQSIKHTKSLL